MLFAFLRATMLGRLCWDWSSYCDWNTRIRLLPAAHKGLAVLPVPVLSPPTRSDDVSVALFV